MNFGILLAIICAWASGFGAAATLDAIWGFTEWDTKSVVLVAMFWGVFGTLSIFLVLP